MRSSHINTHTTFARGVIRRESNCARKCCTRKNVCDVTHGSYCTREALPLLFTQAWQMRACFKRFRYTFPSYAIAHFILLSLNCCSSLCYFFLVFFARVPTFFSLHVNQRLFEFLISDPSDRHGLYF